MMYQTAPRLELMTVNGHWIDAPSTDGRLVVLLGDMLEHFTNGYFRATGHRVRNTADKRMSSVMFFAVNDEQIVAPHSPHVSGGNPARYPAIRQADHIDAEIERARLNAA